MTHLIRSTAYWFVLCIAFAVPLSCLAQPDTIKIGVMLCLTGDCAEWGTNGLKGVQLAAEQINQNGGVLGKKLELVVHDSHDTTPSDSVTAFRKLLTKNVKYVIGPTWTVGGMPVAPIAAKQKDLIVTSPSVGVRDFNESSINILNVWPHDEIATRKLAHYAYSKGWRRAAIFGSQDPWVKTQSDTFEEEFEILGGHVVKRVEPLPGSRELKAEALQIKSSKPDVVFYSNYQVDVFSKELDKIGFSPPKLAILMEKERVKAAQGALEGTVFALYDEPRDDFKEAFIAKFGDEPGITADTAYDVLFLYAKAIEDAGSSSPKEALDQLLNVKDFKGASGTFSINGVGAVNKQPVLWIVRGLEYVKLGSNG